MPGQRGPNKQSAVFLVCDAWLSGFCWYTCGLRFLLVHVRRRVGGGCCPGLSSPWKTPCTSTPTLLSLSDTTITHTHSITPPHTKSLRKAVPRASSLCAGMHNAGTTAHDQSSTSDSWSAGSLVSITSMQQTGPPQRCRPATCHMTRASRAHGARLDEPLVPYTVHDAAACTDGLTDTWRQGHGRGGQQGTRVGRGNLPGKLAGLHGPWAHLRLPMTAVCGSQYGCGSTKL